MIKEIKPRNYWNNKDNCLEAAKMCNSRLDFKKKFRTAYKHCCKNKWLDDVCSHMIEKLKPKNYWNKENCINEAKKYNTLKDFKKNSSTAYNLCLKHKWLNEASFHMEKLGSLYMKVGYKMIFKSELNNFDYIYIGLTCDYKRRIYQHLNSKKDNLYKYILKYKLICYNSYIYHDFVIAEDAKKLEIQNIDYHKKENKYIVLNIRKGGDGIRGKNEYYTKEMCKNILAECNSISDAILKNKKAYEKSKIKGWLKEIAPHIQLKKYPNGFFNKKENCLELSKSCENIKDFRKKYPRAYRVSFINNWIIDFFSDEKINKSPKYWFDKDKCKDAAINCKNRYEFLRKYSAAYQNSLKNNWLNEFFPKK